jgi:hypothetical protein
MMDSKVTGNNVNSVFVSNLKLPAAAFVSRTTGHNYARIDNGGTQLSSVNKPLVFTEQELITACRNAGISHDNFLKIKAYLPV